ncbi:MAG: hypothetical protein JRN06_01985 [Nitrososphaerota archaeon]|nr:hypothetical protein [Nitrososphaerota archaeon]MDG7023375.1 hypothetical protein [Nitrososphaerota archaeon]
MKARALGALLLIALSAFPLQPLTPGASAGVVPIDLGYGSSILFPVKGGTPAFTAGDQVWAMSHFNTTVQVTLSPLANFGGPNSTTYSEVLEPGVPSRLLTINSTDFQGLWTLEAVNSTFPPALFIVSDAASEPANFTLSAFHLKQGHLDLGFATSPDIQMYGASACLVAGADPSVAQIPLPSGIGAGYVNISMNHDSLQALPSPLSANYSLSVELYRSVSFLLPGSASTLVSRAVQVAATDSGLVSDGEPVALSLRHDAQLWPGTYQVRTFFEGAGGVFLSTADVIVTGSGGWVWRGACSTYPVYSNNFAISVRLGYDPGSWPRSAWLTYEASGLQGLAYLPLKVNLSAVGFVGMPWGVRLSSYNIRVSSTTGVLEYDVSNGTIFALLDAPAGQIGYEAGLGSHYFFSGTAGPLASFAVRQVALNVSKLVVQYLVAGSGFAGGRVGVSDSTGLLENATTGPSGEATFYLPPGGYNVTAAGGNSSATATTILAPGRSQQLVLGATNGAGSQTIVLEGLGLAAVVGALANVAIWVRRRERTPGQGRRFSQK